MGRVRRSRLSSDECAIPLAGASGGRSLAKRKRDASGPLRYRSLIAVAESSLTRESPYRNRGGRRGSRRGFRPPGSRRVAGNELRGIERRARCEPTRAGGGGEEEAADLSNPSAPECSRNPKGAR